MKQLLFVLAALVSLGACAKRKWGFRDESDAPTVIPDIIDIPTDGSEDSDIDVGDTVYTPPPLKFTYSVIQDQRPDIISIFEMNQLVLYEHNHIILTLTVDNSRLSLDNESKRFTVYHIRRPEDNIKDVSDASLMITKHQDAVLLVLNENDEGPQTDISSHRFTSSPTLDAVLVGKCQSARWAVLVNIKFKN